MFYSKAHVDFLRMEIGELRRLDMEALVQTKLAAIKKRLLTDF